MDGIFFTLFFSSILGHVCAVVAIIRSIARGLTLLRATYADNGPNRLARRILAWNLIEPGIMVPNFLILLVTKNTHVLDAMKVNAEFLFDLGHNDLLADRLLRLMFCFWPMILVFVIVPLLAQFSTDPAVRWAARKSALLGVPRIIMIIITYSTLGIGVIIGTPYLFWSLKKIRLWNNTLLDSASSQPAAAIVGGKEGMLVLPAESPQSDSFKVLWPKE